jgi:chemotaxis protein MotB
MKKKGKAKKENGERWLLTYADMITLLLALFILLYSMNQVDQAKYEQLAISLNQALGDGKGISIFDGTNGIMDDNGNAILEHTNGSNGQSSTTGTGTVTPEPTEGAASDSDTLTTEEEMNNLENEIKENLKGLNEEGAVGTAVEEKGLIISLADDAFFDSGEAELKTSMKKSLGKIATILNKVQNPIMIEGYTDNIPISSGIYPSNWQLSTSRSSSVAQYLVEDESVDGTRISAVGYGEYRPIATNATEAGRKKNRRVDITILYNDEVGMEFSE